MLLCGPLCLGNPEFKPNVRVFRGCFHAGVHSESPGGRAGNKSFWSSLCVYVCVSIKTKVQYKQL